MAIAQSTLREQVTLVNGHKTPDLFTRLAGWTIRATGGRWGFLFAFGTVLIWALVGPFCGFSENWQLVINTGTTIVTFLMVFLIQNAQNRESKAIHLKLDELILAVRRARNELIDVEHLTDEQLDMIAERYKKVAEKYQHRLAPCFITAAEPGAAPHMTVK
jgi:low affinity Fe/Cu permease